MSAPNPIPQRCAPVIQIQIDFCNIVSSASVTLYHENQIYGEFFGSIYAFMPFMSFYDCHWKQLSRYTAAPATLILIRFVHFLRPPISRHSIRTIYGMRASRMQYSKCSFLCSCNLSPTAKFTKIIIIETNGRDVRACHYEICDVSVRRWIHITITHCHHHPLCATVRVSMRFFPNIFVFSAVCRVWRVTCDVWVCAFYSRARTSNKLFI